MSSRAQIIATIGPPSTDLDILARMIEGGMDAARLNFSWENPEIHAARIETIRAAARKLGKHLPIIQDLPGPRVNKEGGHGYDASAASSFTPHDAELARFGAEHGVEYIALSFVSGSADIEACRKVIKDNNGAQRIIAKIERKAALDNLDAIIAAADAIMIARGDLGHDIPLEDIPSVQADIVCKCKKAGKPVITATGMLLSMVENPEPTRAEVTDVYEAIIEGSDAVMLSEETAKGKHPVEAVAMMEKIASEAEKHMPAGARTNAL